MKSINFNAIKCIKTSKNAQHQNSYNYFYIFTQILSVKSI